MSPSTIILLALLFVAVLLATLQMRRIRVRTEGTTEEIKMCDVTGDACMGGEYCHIHRRLKAELLSPTYYEDEELDRFRGRRPEDYTPEESREWEEVLTTLRDEEVQGWVTSIHRRGLFFPTALRERLREKLREASV